MPGWSWPVAQVLRPLPFATMMSPEPTPDLTEAALLERVARKDEVAFAELYDRISGVLFSIAVKILRDESLAEDVLQDVFMQIWECAGSYDRALGRPLTWALTFTRNKAIDRLRGMQRRARLIEELMADTAPPNHPSPLASAHAADQELARLVVATLAQLSAEQRKVIELAFFAGLTHAEIAEALQQPLGTVKARIRRGLLQMRDALKKHL
jgi:RNA polymerase sigma-70 factor, ECF subfamily